MGTNVGPQILAERASGEVNGSFLIHLALSRLIVAFTRFSWLPRIRHCYALGDLDLDLARRVLVERFH